jgi:hypothetical protein
MVVSTMLLGCSRGSGPGGSETTGSVRVSPGPTEDLSTYRLEPKIEGIIVRGYAEDEAETTRANAFDKSGKFVGIKILNFGTKVSVIDDHQPHPDGRRYVLVRLLDGQIPGYYAMLDRRRIWCPGRTPGPPAPAIGRGPNAFVEDAYESGMVEKGILVP